MSGPLVLGWHNVAPTWAFPAAPGAGPRGLEQQLRLLATTRRVVPLEQMLHGIAHAKRPGRRDVALTFDDGYRDNLELAVPLLERFGLPATFFLVTGFLSATEVAWWERLAWALTCARREQLRWRGTVIALDGAPARRLVASRLGEQLKAEDATTRTAAINEIIDQVQPWGRAPGPELFLDWSGARELVRRGFAVGAHTVTHPVLSREVPDEQRRQATESKAHLERELDVEVTAFAYPNGRAADYTSETVAGVEAAGYAFAVTTVPGRNTADTPLREVRRFAVSATGGLREAVAVWRMLRRL